MSYRVHGDAVLQWISMRTGDEYHGGQGLGIMDEAKQIRAAASCINYNGCNMFVHIVVEDPLYMRALLRSIGMFAFRQLGCRRLTLLADAANLAAVRLHKRLGGVLEGTLEGASRAGTDILVFRLKLDSCPVRRLIDVQRRRFPSTS